MCYYTVGPLRLRNKSQYEEDITKSKLYVRKYEVDTSSLNNGANNITTLKLKSNKS